MQRDKRLTYVGRSPAGERMYRRGAGHSEAAYDSYDDLTKAELQDLLEARGLPKTGNKDELIARLEAA